MTTPPFPFFFPCYLLLCGALIDTPDLIPQIPDRRCHCSVGIGRNMLLARLATDVAKPNGVHVLTTDAVQGLMLDMPVTGLPGIGWRLGRALKVGHGMGG